MSRAFFLLLFALGLAPRPALARKEAAPDACERIKPAQQLSTETQAQVDAMIKVGVTGLGRGEAAVSTDSAARYDTALLGGDDLARSWYTYQLCVLKDVGAISPQMHEELMRVAWGLAPAAPTVDALGAPLPVGAIAPTVEMGDVGVAVAANANLSFLPKGEQATVVLAGCPEMSILRAPKALGLITWKVNGQKHTAGTDVGTAVDVPGGRLSLEAAYRYMTIGRKAQSELKVEPGKVHYIAVDYDYKLGSVASFNLRPTGPVEGEQILARCKETRRIE